MFNNLNFLAVFFFFSFKDSGRWSLSPCDEFSSGFFSYNSQPDVQAFSVDLLGQTPFPPPWCFEGAISCLNISFPPVCAIFESLNTVVNALLLGQGWMSASETSTGEAFGSERSVEWGSATSLLGSAIRYKLPATMRRKQFLLIRSFCEGGAKWVFVL